MTEKSFSTPGSFLILAHHPEKGGFLISQIYVQYGIAGALLLELALEERVTITDRKLSLKPGRASSSPWLNDVITLISQSPKTRKTDYWVRKLATRYNKYKWQILEELAKKMVFRIENRKFLGLIPYRLSYFTESYTRTNLVRRLKSEILSNRYASGESNALAGLVKACNMQRLIANDRDESRRIRDQLKLMVSDSPVNDVLAQTIKQVQAAIITSVTTAVIASTASGRH